MPNQETVLKRAYITIALSLIAFAMGLTMIDGSSTSVQNFSGESKIPNEIVYYPTGEDDLLLVSIDESLVDKPASEPVVTTEEDNIHEYIQRVCESYGNVDPCLIESLIETESSWNSSARNGNYVGLMQIGRIWHEARMERLGVTDLYDPYQNILAGVDYVSELLTQTNGDASWALMIYNMGHKQAYSLYSKGVVSSYARTILNREKELKEAF